MGLRRGAAATGRFPGSRDRDFVDRCRKFLLRQTATQRPRVILTLGTWVPRFIGPLSPQLSVWNRATTLRAIDACSPIVYDVVFTGLEVPPCVIVALTHPALRGPNLWRRRFGSHVGHEAEIALLQAALSRADT
jgi:uracil-DNA glycosylase